MTTIYRFFNHLTVIGYLITLFLGFTSLTYFADEANGAGQVSLADAIYALQVVSGSYPSDPNASYGQVIVVGDPDLTDVERGANLLEVMNGITDASDQNPYMVKLLPGVYDLGSETLQMKPYVDVEGSGRSTTFIQSANDGGASGATGTVTGSVFATIRNLNIRNSGGSDYSIAFYGTLSGYYTQNMVLENVTLYAHNGSVATYGVKLDNVGELINVFVVASGTSNTAAISISNGGPQLTNVMAIANSTTGEATGIENNGSAPSMHAVQARAEGGSVCYGVKNDSSVPIMDGVTVGTSNVCISSYGILNLHASDNLRMNNITVTVKGQTSVTGISNQDSSPIMQNITVAAKGDQTNTGIENTSSSHPIMRDMTVTSNLGTENRGIANLDYSLPLISNTLIEVLGDSDSTATGVYHDHSGSVLNSVTIKSYGGPEAKGMVNVSSDPELDNVSILAVGSEPSYGIQNTASFITIRNSRISGGTYSISHTGSGPAKIAYTMLDGLTEGTSFFCIGNYDESFELLDSACAVPVN